MISWGRESHVGKREQQADPTDAGQTLEIGRGQRTLKKPLVRTCLCHCKRPDEAAPSTHQPLTPRSNQCCRCARIVAPTTKQLLGGRDREHPKRRRENLTSISLDFALIHYWTASNLLGGLPRAPCEVVLQRDEGEGSKVRKVKRERIGWRGQGG